MLNWDYKVDFEIDGKVFLSVYFFLNFSRDYI